MKNHLTKTRLLQIFIALLLTGLFTVAQAQTVNHNVQMQLDNIQSKLVITTRGQCGNNNHNGCIDVKAHKKARINFSFVGNKQCNRAEGAKWEIGEVHLGGKNSQNKPQSWGGLDQEVEDDFNVADASTGLLNKGAGSNEQSIIITDQNESAYDIWYKVTAICRNSSGSILGEPAVSDPRITNGGNP
jgi:hypothetical protein